MIVVDASAIPDGASGARTRLRGWLGAWVEQVDLPPLAVIVARGSTLLDGLALGRVEIVQAKSPGGPLARAWRHVRGAPPAGVGLDALRRVARLWHSETIPSFAPRSVPAFLTLHDLRWNEPRAATGESWRRHAPRHFAARRWLPPIARRLAGIVTVSTASARAIEYQLGVEPARVHCVANANVGGALPLPPAEARALLARLGVARHPCFVSVGHLEPRKGLDLALAALAQASGAAAEARLVLVGGGRAQAAIAAQVESLGLRDRVVFAGRLDDREVATLLQYAVALLFPSRHEGFGLPFWEAQALGCPVVARPLTPFADLPSVAPGEASRAGHAAIVRCEVTAAGWTAALAPLIEQSLPASERRPFRVEAPWNWRDAARALAAVWSASLR